MDNINYFDRYINAAEDSSGRARWVILIIVTTCILVFAGFLNSRPGNWLDARVHAAQNAFLYWNIISNKIRTDTSEVKTFALWDTSSNKFKSDTAQARAFINKYNITSIEELKIWLNGYIISKQQNVQLIRVPFFAFSFDVNDLGIISGIAFVLLMLLMRLCLMRELRNHHFVFEEVKNDPNMLDQVYHILSMKQVLTVPPSRLVWTEYLWAIPTKLLLVLPLGLQFLILKNDLKTLDFGLIFNEWNTRFLIIAYIISLFLILLLTVACVELSIKFDKLWYNQKKRCKHNMKRV
jgi:hypothetical protein